jgi:hypothetical protein
MRLGVATCLAAFALAGAARAQTALGALQEFGAMGLWAPECTKLPAPDNIFVSYFVKGSDVLTTHDAGLQYQLQTFTVADAKKLGTEMLLIQMRGSDGERFVVLRKSGAKLVIWKVTGPGGTVTVSDGKVAANGKPQPLMSHCK